MSYMKILLTGATGFLGSNIAKGLLEQGFEVYATYRSISSFKNCIGFKDKIKWINTETSDWNEKIKLLKPDQLIHAAWNGIDATNRSNWKLQIGNFWLSKEYFDLVNECSIKKVIALGSQAEYGAHNFPVNEMTLPTPEDAYGAVKILTVNYLRNLFKNSFTEWYWVRVFSVFGEGENIKWLIPSVISSLIRNEPIKLTSCEQQYNYMYIDNFVKDIISIVECKENQSGIYNICNSESIILRDLLIMIAELMNVPIKLLRFGEKQQRPGQNMIIIGDNKKFLSSFKVNESRYLSLADGLCRTINYHQI
jgi:nucleoside-diphosphate-sugar epimerase